MSSAQHKNVSPADSETSGAGKADIATSPPQSVTVTGDAHVSTATDSKVVGTLVENPVINGLVQFSGSVTIIYEQKEVTLSPEELTQAQTDYLDYVIKTSAPLDWKGFAADRTPKETPLDCLYVTLTTEYEVEQKPSDQSDSLDADSAAKGRQREKRIEKAELYEALTKHNRLVILGDPGAGKTTLTRFLSLRFAEACREGQKEVVDHDGNHFGPALLPVRVSLSDFARQWDNTRQPDFYSVLAYCACPKTDANAATIALLKTTLKKGAGLILLDGLDEISDPEIRGRIAGELVKFARDNKNQNRMLVTSRIAGYRETAGISGFTPYTLSELNPRQQEQFTGQWFAYYEPQLPYENDESGKRQRAMQKTQWLLDGIKASASMGRCAANPLMLTLLCMIAEPDKPLPTRRVELYKRFSRTLLREWHKGKPDEKGRSITEWEEKFLLPPLAYTMQEANTNGKISRESVLDLLRPILAKHHNKPEDDEDIWTKADSFCIDLIEHTGLFAEYSSGQYGFIHLTFQEYYAARHLANDVAVAKTQIPTFRTQARWEEVIRLAIASQTEENAANLIRSAIWCRDDQAKQWGYVASPHEDILRRDLMLAARCIGDCTSIEPTLARETAEELVAICLNRESKGTYIPLVERARETLGAVLGCEVGAVALQLLIAALKKSNLERYASVRTLGTVGQGSQKALQALLEVLEDEDEDKDIKPAVVRALGTIGQNSKTALDVLLNAINDVQSDVRTVAAEALGLREQGSDDALNALLNTLKYQNWIVQSSIARALGTIGQNSKTALEVLLNACNDKESHVRIAAIRAIGMAGKGSKEALRLLISALEDEDINVCAAATFALGTLGQSSDEALPALLIAFKDEEGDVRPAVARAIGMAGKGSKEALRLLISALENKNKTSDQHDAAAEVHISNVRSAAAEALEA